MAKRINWQYANVRDKVYKQEDNNYGWRQIMSKYITTCNACQRRINVGQQMLWHKETGNRMHVANECKLW
jgi:hypothetical protein